MAFTYTIGFRLPLLPAVKGFPEGGNLWLAGGTFTNTAGSTGGEISNLKNFAKKVIIADAIDESGANPVRVQRNTSADGEITLTTTADSDGSWWAIVRTKS